MGNDYRNNVDGRGKATPNQPPQNGSASLPPENPPVVDSDAIMRDLIEHLDLGHLTPTVRTDLNRLRRLQQQAPDDGVSSSPPADKPSRNRR